jgi:hypothetical protein
MDKKEKLVRNLVNTFNDRDELHIAYKKQVKDMLLFAFSSYVSYIDSMIEKDVPLEPWIDKFIEENFKPNDN